MAQIAIEPIILTNCLLTIGADNYEKHVSRVQFDPSAATVNWKGLHPDAVFSKVARATWTCTLEYAQDWETPNSLSQYLHDNEGTEVAATFSPESGGASWAATILITPGAIGGTVDTVPTATVTLGVKGKPARTPAA